MGTFIAITLVRRRRQRRRFLQRHRAFGVDLASGLWLTPPPPHTHTHTALPPLLTSDPLRFGKILYPTVPLQKPIGRRADFPPPRCLRPSQVTDTDGLFPHQPRHLSTLSCCKVVVFWRPSMLSGECHVGNSLPYNVSPFGAEGPPGFGHACLSRLQTLHINACTQFSTARKMSIFNFLHF